jgi:sugar phosphate isomerase/epimerase
MQIGVTSDDYGAIPVEAVLALLKWAGICLSETTAAIFNHPGRALRWSRGMRLSLHLPNFGNYGFDLSWYGESEKVIREVDKICRYAPAFSFDYAVFHPPEGDSQHTSLDFLIQNLLRIPVPLIIENIRTLSEERFSRLYSVLEKRLGSRLTGICLDIPHAFLAGQDWTSWLNAWGKRIRVVHLSDCTPERDDHLPFGCGGCLSLTEVLSVLKRNGFRGRVNFELNPPSLAKIDSFFRTLILAKREVDPRGISRIERRANALKHLGRLMERWMHFTGLQGRL